MRLEPPLRYRHPIDDPDPALVQPYRRLFAHDLRGPLEAQVQTLADALWRGDPLADAWCSESKLLGRDEAERVFAAALRGELTHAPASLRALITQVTPVPLWVDRDKLALGARTARRAGIIGNFVLADFALMGGYRSAAVAKTLVATGKLTYSAPKRLIDTGRFVSAVNQQGAVLPGGEGFAATLRVRMVHAHIRAALSRDWDVQRWGIPINQSDSLGTNLLFSIGFLEGCKQWGLRFTREEEGAVVHLWRYVGWLMGIEDALLPIDVASAKRALYMVGVSQPAPDEDSRKLASALYAVPLTFAKTPRAQRAVRFEMALRLGMTRRVLGDEGVDQLGLPKSPLRALLPSLVRVIHGIERLRERVPYGTHAAYKLGDLALTKSQSFVEQLLANAAT